MLSLETLATLSKCALLVYVCLERQGPTAIGHLAAACRMSERSVHRALAQLRAAGYSVKDRSVTCHDHSLTEEGTAPVLTDKPNCLQSVDSCPLAAGLETAGVLPWCVTILLDRCTPEVITQQLAHHAQRLAAGFPFKGHPAAYLFKACLGNYAGPAPATPKPQEARQGAPTARRGFPDLDRDWGREVRRMLKSPCPQRQAEARELARLHGVELTG